MPVVEKEGSFVMVPMQLRLHNFMSYRGSPPMVDFSGIHLACLSGENGAGKSALLSAMTWALWGKARERVSDDELISQGCDEMEVEFSWALDAMTYRVLRKRSKLRRGSTFLSFEVGTGTGWRSITGHTVAATERRICATLHMDYLTFINSAFIMQGRADSFTTKTPSERKEVLGDILGLDVYDRYQDQARQQVRGWDAQRTDIQAELRVLRITVDRQRRVESDWEALQASLVEARRALGMAEARHTEWKAAELLAQQQRAATTDLQIRLDRLRPLALRAQERVQSDETGLGVLATLLDRQGEIQAGYEHWLAGRAEEDRLSVIEERAREIDGQVRHWQAIIDQQREMLESAIAGAELTAGAWRENCKALPEWQQNLELLVTHTVGLECLPAVDIRSILVKQSSASADLQGRNTALRTAMIEVRDRISLLERVGTGTGCPICDRVMDAPTKALVLARYKAQGVTMGAQYREHRGQIVNLLSLVEQSRMALAQAEIIEQERAVGLSKQRDLERRIHDGVLARDRVATEECRILRWREQVARSEYAQEAWAQLAHWIGIAGDQAWDATALARVREAVRAGEGWAADWARLEAGRQRQGELAAALADARRSATELVGQLQSEEQALLALGPITAPTEDEGRAADAAVRRARIALAEIQGSIEHTRMQLDDIHSAIESWDLATAKLERIAVERGISEELVRAFGKGGIQALLIEGVLPELETETNLILDRMVAGGMRVEFVTQRETRTGDQPIETLEVRIEEGGHTRKYELYSGGQQFRINFAVRIALSKLLARRSGAQLQTLVIDEGFGTQDGQGRERLMDALRYIGEDFPCVLVITHLRELQDEFPTRIEVTRSELGSTVMIQR